MSNDEKFFYFIQAFRSKVVSWLSAAICVLLFFSSPFQSNQAVRTSLYLMSFIAGNLCLLTENSRREQEQALHDYSTAAVLNRQRAALAVQKSTEPTAPVIENENENESEQPKERFTFDNIGKDRDKFPNVIVLGEPGSGKTTLAEYLGVLLDSDCRVAIHPHAKPGDFKGFNLILGGGRYIGTPDDAPVSWADISGKKVRPTVSQTLKALHQLMIDRYEAYYSGQTGFATIDVYIDELPAIADALGKAYLSPLLGQLIRECRKVGIRLWLLAQGNEVASLGLQGKSSLREGATTIRLGNLANKKAATLYRKKELSLADFQALKASSRPCMVDDELVSLPTYEKMTATIAAAAKPTYGSPRLRKRSS